MTLLLRRMRAQAHIEGLDPNIWSEDDYAVVDETRIGRIYKEPIHGEPKWLWFLQTVPAPPPNQGIAREGGRAGIQLAYFCSTSRPAAPRVTR
jgi:hypothetical protein